MDADGRYGVGMRWLVLAPGAGAFQWGTSHAGSDVLSVRKLKRPGRAALRRTLPHTRLYERGS